MDLFVSGWRLINILIALSLLLRVVLRFQKQHDPDFAWYLAGIATILVGIVVGSSEQLRGGDFGLRIPIATVGLLELHYAVTRFNRREKRKGK